ncbi:MAG: hypothetical protein WC551_09085 [Patescibacteria group bacterium]
MIGVYLIHTITLKQNKGKDQWGEPNPSTDISVKARVDYKERVIQGTGTELVTSTMRVLMKNRTIITSDFATRTANTISYLDIITYDGVDRHILQIATQSDFRQQFMEVYLA